MAKTLLRYPGGKGRLAKRIISLFPTHEDYLEPCCGGAAVLLNKPRCARETLCDIDPVIIKLHRALRDRPDTVIGVCDRIDYTQAWLDKARSCVLNHTKHDDALVAACKIFLHHATRSGSGRGKLATWKRHAVAWYTPEASWVNKRKTLPGFADRLQGVSVREQDCFTAIAQHQGGVIDVDPPYADTEQHGSVDHAALAQALHAAPGHKFITHYRTEEYDALYADWNREDYRLGNQFGGQGRGGVSTITIESLYWC